MGSLHYMLELGAMALLKKSALIKNSNAINNCNAFLLFFRCFVMLQTVGVDDVIGRLSRREMELFELSASGSPDVRAAAERELG